VIITATLFPLMHESDRKIQSYAKVH
jgi:hypothetical protein